MPFYDYDCTECGAFTQMRPMAMAADACDCPNCGEPARRAIFRVPAVLGMNAAQRKAMDTNERSKHAPKHSSSIETSAKHPAGCGCCSGATKKGVFRADGAKTFPSSRPWMISH